uniref:Ground-like domain-containing protein n=1 Tax=Panagrellus redivivus TaxID=6233 RepID=A0A7E4UX27_PANRE
MVKLKDEVIRHVFGLLVVVVVVEGNYGCGLPPPMPMFPMPCPPRPFLPPPLPPPPPPPPPPAPLPLPPPFPMPQPCQPCSPRPYLPPLIQTPRPYEITPEEYIHLTQRERELLAKKNAELNSLNMKNPHDPFEEKRPLPVPIIPDRRPEPRPPLMPMPLYPPPGCGGYYYQQPPPYYQQPARPPTLPPPLPQPIPPPVPPPFHPPPNMFTNCCARCGPGCSAKAFGTKSVNGTVLLEELPLKADENGLKCNDEKLRDIMKKSAHLPLKEAKTTIHEAAELTIGLYFQVVCSAEDFEYVTRSSSHCQVELDHGVCYAFRTG